MVELVESVVPVFTKVGEDLLGLADLVRVRLAVRSIEAAANLGQDAIQAGLQLAKVGLLLVGSERHDGEEWMKWIFFWWRVAQLVNACARGVEER